MIKNLNGKNILLGVTGGISAYKSCELSRLLIKDGADVNVVMTSNAEKFVSALTFHYLTGNKVSNDMYDVSDPKISHIDLADKADLIIICPATANFISKFANSGMFSAVVFSQITPKGPLVKVLKKTPSLNNVIIFFSFISDSSLDKSS